MLVDTHVHLNNEQLYEELENVLTRAREKGVERFLVVGFDALTNTRAIEIAKEYPFIRATAGLHPGVAPEVTEADFAALEETLSHPEIRAVGECGLDYYRGKEHKKQQLEVFERQILFAKKKDLPLVIHMRDAAGDTYRLLERHAPIKGVMHCYSGSREMMEPFLSLGLHISLGGPVTFKNAKTPKEVAQSVPLDKLLVETDAPFLAPHPHRGKRNEPSLLPLIAKAIAEIKGMEYEEIAHTTTMNANDLFRFGE